MAKNKNNWAGIFLLAMIVVFSACGGDETRTPEEIAVSVAKWKTALGWAWGITGFWLIGAIVQWGWGKSGEAIEHGWHFSEEVESLKWRICPPVFWTCLAVTVVLNIIYTILY
jgi:hypothetical protein